jgi:AsmA protein
MDGRGLKRVLRWTLGIAAALALLLVLAALCVLALVDPSRFRPQIEQQARTRFGVPLRLSGPLKWQLWPLFSIASEQGAIGGASGQAAPVAWQRLAVGARWAGLLRGEFTVDSLRIDGMQLVWRRGSDGRSNWEGLFTPSSASSGQRDVSISSLELRNASIVIDDATRGAAWRAVATVKTQFHWQPATSAFTVQDLSVTAQLRGGALPAAGVAITAVAQRIAWRNEPLSLQPTMIRWRLGNAAGELMVSEAIQSSPWRGAGSVQGQSPSLREWLISLGLTPPSTRDATTLQAFTVRSDWRLDPEFARFEPLQTRIDATTLNGSLRWPLQSGAHGAIDLQGDDLNLDRYLPPEDAPSTPFTVPVKVLQALPLQGTLSFRTLIGGGATARNARLTLESDASTPVAPSSP